MSTSKIAKFYRCNAETIRRRLIEHKIKRRFHELQFKFSKKELEKFYNDKKFSTLEISKKHGCSQWTIRSNLIKYKIKLRKSTDFFKWKGPGNQIKPNLSSSKEISYILGVLLGDGWLYKYKNNYFIGLDVIDSAFCRYFYNTLKKINLNPSFFNFKKGKYWRTLACSKLFYLWFNNLKPKDIKKITLKYPKAFIKGIYESEGCLSSFYGKKRSKRYLLITIVNCEKDTIDLTKLLIEKLGLNPRLNLRRPPEPFKPIWALNLCRQDEIKYFLKIIKPIIKNKTKGL